MHFPASLSARWAMLLLITDMQCFKKGNALGSRKSACVLARKDLTQQCVAFSHNHRGAGAR